MTASPSLPPFDSILLVSYGAPEAPDQIEPFLRAVTGGRGIPETRLASVRARYEAFGGRSPLSGECRVFLERLRASLDDRANAPGIYWGNLFAPPMLSDAIENLARDQRRSTLVLPGSAFGPGGVCLRYRLEASRALANVDSAPPLTFAPPFFDLAPFRRALADAILEALAWDELESAPFADSRDERLLLFTAHSTPTFDATPARYRDQLVTACNFVLRAILHAPAFGGVANDVADKGAPFTPMALDSELAPNLLAKLNPRAIDAALAFQSRSGSPATPWLEPDVNLFLQEYKKRRPALKRVIVVPIGFLFENMETVYDLDVELRATCETLDLTYRRARCVGTSERFAEMILELARLAPASFPQCGARCDKCDFSCRLATT